jgi:zinc protease
VVNAADAVAQEIRAMQMVPVGSNELGRAKALLLREIPLHESSIDEIVQGLASHVELNLPLDEPIVAAQRYVDLTPAEVQGAFQRWMRPSDLVRTNQGPVSQ